MMDEMQFTGNDIVDSIGMNVSIGKCILMTTIEQNPNPCKDALIAPPMNR